MSLCGSIAHHQHDDSACGHVHRKEITLQVDALDVTKALWDELVAELLADASLLV